MASADRTLIACLTPAGAGAIATLGVRGANAWSIARSLFRARLPEQPMVGRFYLGRIGGDNDLCDQVVLGIKADGLELHCHGGVEALRLIEELFVAEGAVASTWMEFSRGPGVSPSAQAERLPYGILALEQLTRAPTVRTAAILLDQAHGSFDRALAATNAAIQADDRVAALRQLTRLAQTQHLGRHLVAPFRVVIAGAPNVGKSSLVNAIAGFTRSVVSPVAGTTRDLVSTCIALDGWPVELMDTAGFHETDNALELEGIDRARQALAAADLRLWVVDTSGPPALPPSGLRFDAIVINKVDLPSWGTVVSAVCPAKSVSCKTGQGVAALCQWMGTLLRRGDELEPGEGVAFTPELCAQILLAHQAANEGDWGKVENTIRA